MKCNCNVGGIDRKLRIVAGLAIIAVGAYFQSWWGAVGIIPLTTGIVGWCPAYFPMGITTAKKCDSADDEK